jgi:hypothetical protein
MDIATNHINCDRPSGVSGKTRKNVVIPSEARDLLSVWPREKSRSLASLRMTMAVDFLEGLF